MINEELFKGTTCIGKVCSNFDHEVNHDVVRDLQEIPNSHAEYPGWDFWSMVAYDEERKKFVARVMCYGDVAGYPEGDTFEELKEEICNGWGYG